MVTFSSDNQAPARMIEWLFFDVGNVLLDDAPQDFAAMIYFHGAIARKQPDYPFEQMLKDREDLGRRGERLILAQIAGRFLSPDEIKTTYRAAREELASRYDEFNLLIPQAIPTLELLARRFQLGIIANQPTECRAGLERQGLLPFFQVIAISDELRMRKPDRGIFEWALNEARCPPPQAVMIGDRLDNDILPAASLGLKTIHLDWLSHKERVWSPTDPRARLFLESADRVPYFGDHRHLPVQPDARARRLQEIPSALDSLFSQ